MMPDDDSVYRRLRDAIVEGRFAPGMRLVEQALAKQLGVSRTPVREALRHLEADGLVVIERNRGAAVRPLSAPEVFDLYELRGRLESYAAELAAQRASDLQRSVLHEAAAMFDAAVTTVEAHGTDDLASMRALNAANRALHDGVAAAAAHARLAALLSGTVDVPLVFRALQSFSPEQLDRSAMFHHLIVDAIDRRDGQRAGRLMAEHIAQGHDMVSLILAPAHGERRHTPHLRRSRQR